MNPETGGYVPPEAEKVMLSKEGARLSPEQIKQIKITEVHLLHGGAKVDDEGKLHPTDAQIADAKREMDRHLMLEAMSKVLSKEEINAILVSLREISEQYHDKKVIKNYQGETQIPVIKELTSKLNKALSESQEYKDNNPSNAST